MAFIEGELTDRRLALNGRRKALLVAAVSTFAAGVITVGGLKASNESTEGALGAGYGDLRASCREAILLPKRGWVCMSERFVISPGSAAADRRGRPSTRLESER